MGNKALYKFLLLLALGLHPLVAFSSQRPDSLNTIANPARLKLLSAGLAAGYASSIFMLHRAWYKNDPQSRFRFHNDFPDWKQVDKAGHFYTSFHYSRFGTDALRWAGVENKKAILYGGLLGFVLQMPIEVFDGFSPNYGASMGDVVANGAGSAFVIAQELAWKEIRVMPKFSFHPTQLAIARQEFFGPSLAEQVLKDYNGQSYWLSVDVSAFIARQNKYPKWLNFALGYGAMDMMYGNPEQNRHFGYASYRRFFLSPDIHLMNIHTKSPFLQKIFYVLSAFRIPMPAIEFNSKNQLLFHPLYF